VRASKRTTTYAGSSPRTGPGSIVKHPVPSHGYNRPGANTIKDLMNDWWRQGMVGVINAHCDWIKAFSETDFNPNLQVIDVSRSNS
jgi:hypothetical protein